MSENKDFKSDSSSSKDLLYSEILNSSVVDHVHELLQKKEKSSTFPVRRSSVLEKVSILLRSLEKAKEDVKNIEIIEEGEPVIDMSVTFIEREDESECDSDNDARNANIENEEKDKKLITCSESGSELSKNESEKIVLDDLFVLPDSDGEISENESKCDSDNDTRNANIENEAKDKKLITCFESGSELSENESEENVLDDLLVLSNSDGEISENESEEKVSENMLLCLDNKGYKKGEETTIKNINLDISSDSEDNTQSEMSVLKDTGLFACNEQSKIETSKFVVEGQNLGKFLDSDDEQSNQENDVDQEKYPNPPKLDFGPPISFSTNSSCKYQNYSNLGLSSEKKRKLITVIDEADEQNMYISTKLQRV